MKYKLEFLKKTSAYLEPCFEVDVIETHMSWVFLTGDYAYKLKKPFKYSYIDLSKLAYRHENCCRELRINQLLAPGIYLGCIPLYQDDNLTFYPLGSDQRGRIVEWLLKMCRFPQKLTLKHLILNKTCDNNNPEIEKASRILSDFYKKAKAAKLTPEEYQRRFKEYINQNLSVLVKNSYGLNEQLVIEVHNRQFALLLDRSKEIQERVSQGKLIECHGDLRPEHICLTNPPIFVDRLEFSAELRSMDPVDELSYLAMECELLGNTDIGPRFFKIYQNTLSDSFSDELVMLYKSYRACLRACLCARHLDDPRITDLNKWRQKTKQYFRKALNILFQG